MASLLGSMAGALGKGLQQTALINEENKRRQQDRNFQIDMEDRRAKRQERLAKMRMDHDSSLQAEQRKWQTQQADTEFGRKEDLLKQRLGAEQKAAQAEATREELTRRADQLNERASKYDEVLLKHMDPETGMVVGPDSVSSWQSADLKNLDYLDRVLSNYDEQTLKAAGRWQDYLIVKETIAEIKRQEAAAAEAAKQAEQGSGADERQPSPSNLRPRGVPTSNKNWVDPVQARSVFDEIVSGGE